MGNNIKGETKSEVKCETEDRLTSDKLLYTTVGTCPGAFLMRGNRLLSASLFSSEERITGGIYIARVKELVKNLDACFVEIQKDLVCFLPGKEMGSPCVLNRTGQSSSGTEKGLKPGDLVLVQGLREAQKTKQPAVTTRISLSNPFFAISLGPGRTGYSSKLSKEKKEEIRHFLIGTPYFEEDSSLKPLFTFAEEPAQQELLKNVPSAGIIARTECAHASPEELLTALQELLKEFRELFLTAFYRSAFTCLKPVPKPWQEALTALVIPGEAAEIVTDDPALYQEIIDSDLAAPPLTLRLYEDAGYPLEKLYALNTKLNEALGTRIWLRSGAYLIIEPTEALTVIDVNSGKFEGQRDNAAFIRSVNLEAADEIARQIRLRNLSGMILVDFINMTDPGDQEELIRRMRENVRLDRVKTAVIDFTKLGLMEITRQKKSPPLAEQARAAGFLRRK